MPALQDVADLIAECLCEDPAGRPTAQQLMQRLGAMQQRAGKPAGGAAEAAAAAPAAPAP